MRVAPASESGLLLLLLYGNRSKNKHIRMLSQRRVLSKTNEIHNTAPFIPLLVFIRTCGTLRGQRLLERNCDANPGGHMLYLESGYLHVFLGPPVPPRISLFVGASSVRETRARIGNMLRVTHISSASSW